MIICFVEEALDALGEHDPDIVKIWPTMFGEGTHYIVDRRTDPLTVTLHGPAGEIFKGDAIQYEQALKTGDKTDGD